MDTFESFNPSFSPSNATTFDDIALQLFRFQAENNPLYRTYLDYLGKKPKQVQALDEIPFLPISFFKTHSVATGTWNPEVTFSSSGTTGMVTSKHAVWSLAYYLENTEKIFCESFGPLQDYHFLALLPSYLERQGSSLIAMIDYFIKQSGSEHSGFYLDNVDELLTKIDQIRHDGRKIILWGVSFALLDLAERFQLDLHDCIVMETGGMKGRRKEWVREELHEYLCGRFNVPAIYSEYGMTELLSQAYSAGGGYYHQPYSMKIMIRDINDPFKIDQTAARTGGINIIDLANAHSCAFIETQDLGRVLPDGRFEILGRIDNSDIRGCNLLVG